MKAVSHVRDTTPIKVGSLFTGIGGIELGLESAGLPTPAWVSEVHPGASAVLRERFTSPNIGDVTLIRWEDVEPVDLIAGGFPCQDISIAGKGAGIHGRRSGLWKSFKKAIRCIRPKYVFVENVSAIRWRGLDEVTKDLAQLGYIYTWSTLRSSDVGAPHVRQRMFILAFDSRLETLREERLLLADSCGERLQRTDNRFLEYVDTPRYSLGGRDDTITDITGAVPRVDRVLGSGKRGPGSKPWYRLLNPEFVEWMMGFPIGWTEVVARTTRIKVLGNAVQPQVAAVAFAELHRRLMYVLG